MKKHHVYVCGRCGYRSHSKIICPTCNIHLEAQCKKCLTARGNCICRIHGPFKHGKQLRKSKRQKESKKKVR